MSGRVRFVVRACGMCPCTVTWLFAFAAFICTKAAKRAYRTHRTYDTNTCNSQYKLK